MFKYRYPVNKAKVSYENQGSSFLENDNFKSKLLYKLIMSLIQVFLTVTLDSFLFSPYYIVYYIGCLN